MERIDTVEDVVDLGGATELTRGPLPIGAPDTDGVQYQFGAGLSEED